MNRKEWYIAVILTFLTFCAWVVFDIVHTRYQVEIPTDLQNLTEPVDPNFNTSALDSP